MMVVTVLSIALTVVVTPVVLAGLDSDTSKSSRSSISESATVARLITSGVMDALSLGAV